MFPKYILLSYKYYSNFTELASPFIQCMFFKFPVLINTGETFHIKYDFPTPKEKK